MIENGEIRIDNGINYSLNEKIVGTWVDGKPLYQKTIYGKSITNYGKSNNCWICHLPHNIGDLDTAFIVDASVRGDNYNANRVNSDIFAYTYIDEDNIRFDISYNGTLWPNDLSYLHDFYVTIRYTKKGDSV